MSKALYYASTAFSHSLPACLLLFSFTCVPSFHLYSILLIISRLILWCQMCFNMPVLLSVTHSLPASYWFHSHVFHRSIFIPLLMYLYSYCYSYLSDRRGYWRGFYFPATAHLCDAFFSQQFLLSKHCHPWVFSWGLLFFGETDWKTRLREGLLFTSDNLATGVASIFIDRRGHWMGFYTATGVATGGASIFRLTLPQFIFLATISFLSTVPFMGNH